METLEKSNGTKIRFGGNLNITAPPINNPRHASPCATKRPARET
jgi:hypothetical protein